MKLTTLLNMVPSLKVCVELQFHMISWCAEGNCMYRHRKPSWYSVLSNIWGNSGQGVAWIIEKKKIIENILCHNNKKTVVYYHIHNTLLAYT